MAYELFENGKRIGTFGAGADIHEGHTIIADGDHCQADGGRHKWCVIARSGTELMVQRMETNGFWFGTFTPAEPERKCAQCGKAGPLPLGYGIRNEMRHYCDYECAAIALSGYVSNLEAELESYKGRVVPEEWAVTLAGNGGWSVAPKDTKKHATYTSYNYCCAQP